MKTMAACVTMHGCDGIRDTPDAISGSDAWKDPDGKSMTVAEAAHKLGVSVVALSRVLNGRAGISVAMALKLEAAGWATADAWLNLQTHYDLAQERNRISQWPSSEEESEDPAYAVKPDAVAAL